ncbi:hypothetical protein BH18ACI3_BH18ACI3_17790 [soil metagenome]
MEANSRMWMIRCPECEFERSFLDMGGIRWKAHGNQRNYMDCQSAHGISIQEKMSQPKRPRGRQKPLTGESNPISKKGGRSRLIRVPKAQF